MSLTKFFSVLVLCFLVVNCSNNNSNDDQNNSENALIGRWFRESTEDQDGIVTDDSQSCLVTEFTSELYIVTEYSGADCSIEFTSANLPYTLINDKIYLGDVNQDIFLVIVELNNTTLKLRQDYSDNQNNMFYDIVTYSKMQ